MKPVTFDEANITYAEHQPEYLPLPALKIQENKGLVISCWELTDYELDEVKKTKKIYLHQLTFNTPLQPVRILTKIVKTIGSGK
jgi:glycerophosphoryl diester phosphodiesterase